MTIAQAFQIGYGQMPSVEFKVAFLACVFEAAIEGTRNSIDNKPARQEVFADGSTLVVYENDKGEAVIISYT